MLKIRHRDRPEVFSVKGNSPPKITDDVNGLIKGTVTVINFG
jgi:hypothetical protein